LGTVCSWQSYVLHLDTDDLKLALLAGCDTANTDRSYWGSFPKKAHQIGIDATVSFTGLVQYPANCGTSCN
jgi:hypothetical protein